MEKVSILHRVKGGGEDSRNSGKLFIPPPLHPLPPGEGNSPVSGWKLSNSNCMVLSNPPLQFQLTSVTHLCVNSRIVSPFSFLTYLNCGSWAEGGAEGGFSWSAGAGKAWIIYFDFGIWPLGFFFPASPGHGKREKEPRLITLKE